VLKYWKIRKIEIKNEYREIAKRKKKQQKELSPEQQYTTAHNKTKPSRLSTQSFINFVSHTATVVPCSASIISPGLFL
jgi:hypothetical protein